MNRRTNADTRTVTIRLPNELDAVVRHMAANDQRTFNQQIIYLIQRGLIGLRMTTQQEEEGQD